MKAIANAAIALLESGESFVQATILASSGSTPRGAGSCMLVLCDGSIRGTVGGGSLEGGIIKAASDIMREKRTRSITVSLDGDDPNAPDVICGGMATVLIDYIDPSHAGHLVFFKALLNALNANAKAWILTAPPAPGSSAVRHQCLLFPSGPPIGADGLDPAVIKAIESRVGSYDAFTKLDYFDVYLHNIGTDGVAYIFGAGHCGEKLAPILSGIGFGVVVIDDRAEFANTVRFPAADEIIVPDSTDIPFATVKFSGDSYIVIITRGHAHDEIVLRGALRTPAAYIGMIGSRKKRETVYERLLADGYTQNDISRVHSPIGLEIGAETPEEIAVSIAAEMIKVRALCREMQ